jgi:hypothetical protein
LNLRKLIDITVAECHYAGWQRPKIYPLLGLMELLKSFSKAGLAFNAKW